MDNTIRSPRMAGHAIRTERKARGWSQTELAKRINVRQATISKLESGGSVNFATVLAALAALGLELKAGPRGSSGSDEPTLF